MGKKKKKTSANRLHLDYILNFEQWLWCKPPLNKMRSHFVASKPKPLCCIHSRNLSRIILMLTCVSAKTGCVTPTVRLCVCVWASCGGRQRAHLWLYLCLGRGSKSPVNQTEVIRNCLHRRRAIVCPDGELIPPKVLPAPRHAACLEIPSQIKSQFSWRYLIPPTHLISCFHLRSCLGAAIRGRGRGTLRSCSWQINS